MSYSGFDALAYQANEALIRRIESIRQERKELMPKFAVYNDSVNPVILATAKTFDTWNEANQYIHDHCNIDIDGELVTDRDAVVYYGWIATTYCGDSIEERQWINEH